jgi:SpoVK/Ycf46/Vps4 family AAA+-type ATPase
VRLDSVISSLLGDTAKNIRSIFDYISVHPGILFIDEMDAVAKLRSDQHELGELKRVVNTLIQGLDSLDERSIVIGATNHAELLDPAIWRRFPYKIELNFPNTEIRRDIWRHYLSKDDPDCKISRLLALISEGLTGSDIQNLALAARRQALFDTREPDWSNIAWAVYKSKAGRFVIPERSGLSTEQKKQLAVELVSTKVANGAEVARLLGVSRQTISSYLKEESGGD